MRDELARFIDTRIPTQVVGGTVVRVDKARALCDVQPADTGAPELLDVQLRAVDDGSTAGFVLWPVVGSPVLVGLIDNDPNNCVVVAVSQVERLTLATQDENLHSLLKDIIAEVRALKFTTNAGPTIALVTDPKWALLDARIDKLLLP
jgi:hypothetical protein